MTLKKTKSSLIFSAVFIAFLVMMASLAHTAVTSTFSLNSYGRIVAPTVLDGYECGNYNSTHYYARRLTAYDYELLSTNAANTIQYALGKLTFGRTWREYLVLKGNFLIDKTINLNQGNTILDCEEATLTLTTSTTLFSVDGGRNYVFLGGHWVGPRSGSPIALRFMHCSNILIDGIDIEGFTNRFGGIIIVGLSTSGFTAQNIVAHDNDRSGIFTLLNSGFNNIINCVMGNIGQGIFVSTNCGNNRIVGCEFYDWTVSGGHAIYLDGSGNTEQGSNEISGCSFHDGVNGAGLHMKCRDNIIHDNKFYNFLIQGAVPFSIYSEYPASTANDNEIYNNDFINCYYGIWLGHNPANAPTLRNKIHSNNFVNVAHCIMLNPFSGATNTVEDTWIYYNNFTSCSEIFPLSESPFSLVKNTVVAYNNFGGTVIDLLILQQYENSMVYGNIGMADYNVPSSLPISPR